MRHTRLPFPNSGPESPVPGDSSLDGLNSSLRPQEQVWGPAAHSGHRGETPHPVAGLTSLAGRGAVQESRVVRAGAVSASPTSIESSQTRGSALQGADANAEAWGTPGTHAARAEVGGQEDACDARALWPGRGATACGLIPQPPVINNHPRAPSHGLRRCRRTPLERGGASFVHSFIHSLSTNHAPALRERRGTCPSFCPHLRSQAWLPCVPGPLWQLPRPWMVSLSSLGSSAASECPVGSALCRAPPGEGCRCRLCTPWVSPCIYHRHSESMQHCTLGASLRRHPQTQP